MKTSSSRAVVEARKAAYSQLDFYKQMMEHKGSKGGKSSSTLSSKQLSKPAKKPPK